MQGIEAAGKPTARLVYGRPRRRGRRRRPVRGALLAKFRPEGRARNHAPALVAARQRRDATSLRRPWGRSRETEGRRQPKM